MVNKKRSPELLLKLAIVFSMLLWGLSWPSSKVLTHYCTAVNFVVYRYAIVLLTLLPVLLFMKIKLGIRKEGIPVVILSGILLALYSYLFFAGLKFGFAGSGGVLVTVLNPIMAYFLGMIVMRRRPVRNETIGLVLGLVAGCVLLNIWNNFNSVLASGNLYFLLAAFIWAVMSRFTALAARYGSPFSFSFWMYLVTFLSLLPIINVQELKGLAHLRDMSFWGNLFFSSSIVTGLATTVYFFATSKLGSEKASSYIFMVPLAAALSSFVLLGEQILLHTIIGGILGLVAVYMINRKPFPQ